MSGLIGAGGIDNGSQAVLSANSSVNSELMQIMNAAEIQPGSPPSYELCKVIYTSHPLGAKMAEGPIELAQSQEREIAVPDGPEDRLIEAFNREWKSVGTVGADVIIRNVMKTARIYGIASLAMGERGKDPAKPVPTDRLHEADLYFNVLDPLNTAGSLVLNQDPNAPDFQKPTAINVGPQLYHPSNTVVMMNEEPIYISFSNSAFGFVGRSCYQRSLFPLKSYIQTMLTNDWVAYKAGVLVAKMKQETSNANRRLFGMFGWKRSQLKTAQTGNVLSVSPEESIESIDLHNMAETYRLARELIVKDIAVGAKMPARMLDQETLAEGFGEGSEDAKQIALFIDTVRKDMQPLYTFMDAVVMRRAWTPNFYKDLQRDFPEYRRVDYQVAFTQWRNSFEAVWPSLLVEPESERILVEEVRFKSVVALIETLAPLLDKENKTQLVMWVADEINNRKDLFMSDLQIDEKELLENGPDIVQGRDPDKEPETAPFSYRDSADVDPVVRLRNMVEQRKARRRGAA